MADKQGSPRVRPLVPPPDVLEKRVRDIAQESFNVLLPSWHAEKRQEQRDITDQMVMEVLRTGYVDGEVRLGKRPGELKFKMTKRMNGNREVGVVSVLMKGPRLLVVTVEWEDL